MAPDNFNDVFIETVSIILDSIGKSNRSLINGLTLLRLPEEVQKGLKTGVVSLSCGYVFAANLDCSHFMEVYQDYLNSEMTKEALKKRFKRYKDASAAGQAQARAKKHFVGLSASMKSTKAVVEKDLQENPAAYARGDIERILTEMDEFRAFLNEKLLTLPEEAVAETPLDGEEPAGGEGVEPPPPEPPTPPKKKKIIA